MLSLFVLLFLLYVIPVCVIFVFYAIPIHLIIFALYIIPVRLIIFVLYVIPVCLIILISNASPRVSSTSSWNVELKR